MAELSGAVDYLLGSVTRAQSNELRQELAAAGVPASEAAMIARLYDLDGAVGMARLACETGTPAAALASGFVDLGRRLGLDWAQGQAARMNPNDPWERVLVGGLARDFQQMRLDFLARGSAGGRRDPQGVVADWAAAQAGAIGQLRAVVQRAQAAIAVTPAMLGQIASHARSLLAR